MRLRQQAAGAAKGCPRAQPRASLQRRPGRSAVRRWPRRQDGRIQHPTSALRAPTGATVQLTLTNKHTRTPRPQALANLLHVKDVVTDFMVRTEEQRINKFFSAAGHGDVQSVRMMLSQEMDPNTTDYDGGRPARWRQRCQACGVARTVRCAAVGRALALALGFAAG
jgi:hypothetical protein